MKSFEEWFNTPCTDYTPVDIDVDKGYVTFIRDKRGIRIEVKWDGEYVDCFHRLITLCPKDAYCKLDDEGNMEVYIGHILHTLYPGDIITLYFNWD